MTELKMVKHNLQPPEGPWEDKRGNLDIVKIWPTIQGEGPYYGCPAVFVRFAGCNLQCPMCDADYTSERRKMSPGKIVDEIQKYYKQSLVVLTGGEPFRQNLDPLVRLLINTGMTVQIETNGCYYQPAIPYDKIMVVCSPKTPKIHPDLPVHCYKYVLDEENISEGDGLPTSVLGMDKPPARPRDNEWGKVPIYVQPADEFDEEKTRNNMEMTAAVVMKFGYRLSIQIQKIIGLE
jgi:organic radical activating enzyme